MKTAIALITAACLLSPFAFAETVNMPNHQSDGIAKPKHGTNANAVESKFGSPISKHGPVGDPAIIYWEYDQFTVYFEGEYVIHAVSKLKSGIAVNK